ncbi:hypothetical protein V2A60_004189 [Cordyceps javanica]
MSVELESQTPTLDGDKSSNKPSMNIEPKMFSINSAASIPEQRLGAARPLRVITIGAGASGLNLAHQIVKHMQQVEHVVYEKNPEVGGTCYAPASEILEYFRRVAHKYELYRFIKLNHECVGATWDDEAGRWSVKIKNVKNGAVIDDWCDFLINASGVLNNWKWPDIPGLDTFKGKLVHSAVWPEDVDWANRKVAVLGCGSSGVQLVPAIQPEARELVTFVRTPTWITASFAQSKAGPNGSNFNYSAKQKKMFEENPEEYLKYRKEIEGELNQRFRFIVKDSSEQEEAFRFAKDQMRTKLGEGSRLLKHMIPTFSVGCRRPTPGNGYLEALGMPNVRVVTDSITEIVPEGIKLATGELIDVEIIVCATGFDMSFCPRHPVIGQEKADLAEQWRARPVCYFSLAAPNFPNYFMFLGPNAPVGHGSVLPLVEHAAKYMIRMMHKCQTERIKSVAVRKKAAEDFTAHSDEFMKRTAWSSHCRSWFKNGKIDGPVVALHPGSRIHWLHMLEQPRFEDYIWTPMDANMFSYLGNGFSTREEEGKDTTYYFDRPDQGFEHIRY